MKSLNRFEKGAYEMIANSSVLGRARSIKHARKWHAANPVDSEIQFHAERLAFSPWRKLLSPLLNWIDRAVVYPWVRETMITHGFNWEDVYVHDEVALRRSPFYENIWRESCHPYEWIQNQWRRERFFKIERVLNGFEVPEYIQQESRESSAADAFRKAYDWKQFVYNNYTSDTTPGFHNDRGGMIVLELFYQYGLLKQSHYDRYFFNEEDYNFTDQLNIVDFWRKNPYYIELDTESGKSKFEDKVNNLIENYPGLIVPEGQSFDFESFYARRALLCNQDVSKFSAQKVETIRAQLAQEGEKKGAMGLSGETDGYSGQKNTVGAEPAEDHTTTDRRAFMN